MAEKFAVTQRLPFMVTMQVGEVPVQAPDQPVNIELPSGVAVRVTTAPGLKVVPSGF